VLLHEGAGDMKTAEGGGVRALTGVRDRRNRILSAVFDLYSPLTLLIDCLQDYYCDFDWMIRNRIRNPRTLTSL